MILTATGKIKELGDIEEVEGRNAGTYKKQNLVLTITESGVDTEYYTDLAMEAFGDKVAGLATLSVGDTATIKYTIKSKEWKGRWFTNLSFYALELDSASATPEPTPVPTPAVEDDDDVPF